MTDNVSSGTLNSTIPYLPLRCIAIHYSLFCFKINNHCHFYPVCIQCFLVNFYQLFFLTALGLCFVDKNMTMKVDENT